MSAGVQRRFEKTRVGLKAAKSQFPKPEARGCQGRPQAQVVRRCLTDPSVTPFLVKVFVDDTVVRLIDVPPWTTPSI